MRPRLVGAIVRLIQAITRVKCALTSGAGLFASRANSSLNRPECGEAGQNCVILDVSEYGARIMVEESGASLPKEIWLFLNPTGTRRRRCRVIWRSEDQIGVSYLGSWETREPEN
jgi:hypothetical protein